MAFSEFYCQTTGSNLNAGSTTGNSAVYTGVGDSDGTSVFTPSDGSTPASTVSVGDFASVYVTSGATVATFIGRVTNVAAGVNGAITVSTTAKSGTFPANSSGAHTITCKTGGAWKGPNGAVAFPFNFITNALKDVAGDIPRVNFKNNATFSITAAMSHNNAGPVWFQGYASSPGDLGQANIDGGTSGASYILLTIGADDNHFADLIFSNNGASGAMGLVEADNVCGFARCVFHDSRGSGIESRMACTFHECEAYNTNKSNTGTRAGFLVFASSGNFVRCISHDNTGGSNADGFLDTGSEGIIWIDCISDTNTGRGFSCQTSAVKASILMNGCVAYNNSLDGLNIAGPNLALIENSNFETNGGYGINTAATVIGCINNCGFGSGTQANTSGQTNGTTGMQIVGSITYASNVTAEKDPANGDFRISLAAAQGTGRGKFMETAPSYAGAVAYPDVGAAQHLGGGGGGILTSSIIQGLCAV